MRPSLHNPTGNARLLAVVLPLALVPLAAIAELPGHDRALADKLRYGPGQINHPVRVVPSAAISIPKNWPLDVDGSITCLTCHRMLPSLDGEGGVQLRGSHVEALNPSGFCMNCHNSDGRRSTANMHWLALRRAHLGSGAIRSPEFRGLLDADSRRCMECHDGVNAVESRFGTGWNRGPGYVGNKERNHPVGVRYPVGTAHGTRTRFRPLRQLPKEIRLPRGNVTCVSCHNLYAGDRDLLSVAIEGSALCFTCHAMD